MDVRLDPPSGNNFEKQANEEVNKLEQDVKNLSSGFFHNLGKAIFGSKKETDVGKRIISLVKSTESQRIGPSLQQRLGNLVKSFPFSIDQKVDLITQLGIVHDRDFMFRVAQEDRDCRIAFNQLFSNIMDSHVPTEEIKKHLFSQLERDCQLFDKYLARNTQNRIQDPDIRLKVERILQLRVGLYLAAYGMQRGSIRNVLDELNETDSVWATRLKNFISQLFNRQLIAEKGDEFSLFDSYSNMIRDLSNYSSELQRDYTGQLLNINQLIKEKTEEFKTYYGE